MFTTHKTVAVVIVDFYRWVFFLTTFVAGIGAANICFVCIPHSANRAQNCAHVERVAESFYLFPSFFSDGLFNNVWYSVKK